MKIDHDTNLQFDQKLFFLEISRRKILAHRLTDGDTRWQSRWGLCVSLSQPWRCPPAALSPLPPPVSCPAASGLSGLRPLDWTLNCWKCAPLSESGNRNVYLYALFNAYIDMMITYHCLNYLNFFEMEIGISLLFVFEVFTYTLWLGRLTNCSNTINTTNIKYFLRGGNQPFHCFELHCVVIKLNSTYNVCCQV